MLGLQMETLLITLLRDSKQLERYSGKLLQADLCASYIRVKTLKGANIFEKLLQWPTIFLYSCPFVFLSG